ncbi:MAG: 50S ribosomal protein L11 methyltransferase [SAR324 cluster bacterium]|nr:50S ribosomal protein L11 methyltransferase [SAR324 cluster bacterium]
MENLDPKLDPTPEPSSDQNKNQNYLEINLQISKADFENLSTELFEIGALGLEEMSEMQEAVIVKAYFASSFTEVAAVEALIVKSSNGQFLGVESKLVENWQENWKEHFKPLEIGSNILVRPPWETAQPDKIEVVIYPGLGFGTGYHESTALALASLEELAAKKEFTTLLDVGAGSGILTIAALKLGATSGMALEIEKEALAEIPVNLDLSGLDPSLISCLLGGPEKVEGTFELVIANITGDVLLELADDLSRLCSGYLLLSGIAPEYVEPLKERFSTEFDLEFSKCLEPWNSQSWVKKHNG